MKQLTGIALALTGAMIFASPTTVEAKIYKCVGADGSTSYSQRPCATTETTSKVLQSKATREKFDCRVARTFSGSVAEQMKVGKSADELFATYGGLSAISPTTVSVINYVYSHKSNVDMSVNRIVALSGARCESGSYSRSIECTDFPTSFISEVGGCSVAKGESSPNNGSSQNASSSSSNSSNKPGSGSDSAEAVRVRNKNYDVLAETANDRERLCRERIGDQISALQEAMRGRLDTTEHNALNDKRKGLTVDYKGC